MKKLALTFSIIASCILTSYGQQVFWANQVIQFSSQYGNKAFSAQQVLGPPNALPTYGKSMVAWAPDVKGNRASITVSFEKATQVQQIAVGENLLAGSIEKIFLTDTRGIEHLVYNNPNPQPKTPDVADMFNHYIPLTPYRVQRLRLELNYANFRNIPQIDCIGISADKKRVVPKINTIQYTSFVPNPENLGSNINSPYHDMLPIISPDDRTLYFARKNAPENMGSLKKDDIYISQRLANGIWSKAVNIGSPLNTDEHNFVCAISPDGNTMYLANRYDYKTEGQGVAVSYRDRNGKWGKPKPLNVFNMYNNNKYASYHISIDEKVMVMAIERDDTYGDMDLYVSFRYADGNWSEPMNMGPDLNTAGAEASVFLAADGKTLYFSSNGHAGYGDLDMFMSKRLDNSWKNWTTPVNLGSKINTPGMDVYYTIPASGEYAYYSSERGGYGRNDIFRIKLPRELRPDAVKINQGGLYSHIEADIPKLKPYQEQEVSELDSRIEQLKNQLNQPGSSTNRQQDYQSIAEKEEQLNREIEELESKYQNQHPHHKPTTSFNYPTVNNIHYDASQDAKINELRRKLDKVKLDQPGIAQQTSSSGNQNALTQYEEKLASYQTTRTEQNTSPTRTKEETPNEQLSAYEQKLKELQSTQKKSPTPTQPATRIARKTNEESNEIETNLKQPTNETIASIGEQLNESDSFRIKKGTPNLIAHTDEGSQDFKKWQDEITMLEDSLQKLQQQRDIIQNTNEANLQLSENLQQEQQELLSEKEEIALAISQMRLEKEQLDLEKKRLEKEKQQLDRVRSQQHKDINAMRKELDSLQQIQNQIKANTPASVTAQNHVSSSIEEDLNNLKQKVGEKYTLNSVYFTANASFIQTRSHADLDRLAVYLIKNSNLSMEIGGHTNGLCDDAFCNQLSTKRAQSVVEYLIKKGVPPEKLSYKGYGKTKNIADNNTEQGRKLNQRVEITITEIK